jgi:hypothetical protein
MVQQPVQHVGRLVAASVSIAADAVPEPGSLGLLATAAGMLAMMARRRRV